MADKASRLSKRLSKVIHSGLLTHIPGNTQNHEGPPSVIRDQVEPAASPAGCAVPQNGKYFQSVSGSRDRLLRIDGIAADW
jgi:hypothetical protein